MDTKLSGRSKRRVLALAAAGALWLAMGTSSAHALIFTLNQDGCTGGCGFGSTVFGTVNVVQGLDANHVDITVNLNSPNGFVDTGAGESLEFSIAGAPAITITNLTSGFVVGPAPAAASTFGSFNYSIDCGGEQAGHCGKGASAPLPGPLSFTVERTTLGALSLVDFIGNAGGFFFVSDLLGPSGNTGNVAARGPTVDISTVGPSAVVPEPSSLLLLGLGLAGMGLRRRGT